MSYPAITEILNEMHVDLATADDEVLTEALWQAFHRNLAGGVCFLEDFVKKFATSGEKRLLHVGDPNSLVARQVNRLLGTDVARQVCEQKLGVVFGFYNCHAPVVARRHEELAISLREQIQLQNGALAYANC